MDDEEPKLNEPTEPIEPVQTFDQDADAPEDLGTVDEAEDQENEPGPGPSWIPIIAVGIAALVLGLFLGYMGRGQFGPEAQASRATQTAVAGASATQAAANQELMNYLVSQARHAKGPEDAKVTIIEFSDFQ